MDILMHNIDNPEDALVVSFDEAGTVESLHIDQFDLGFLGKKTITRATDIVFHDDQTWAIHLLTAGGSRIPTMRSACGFTSYEQARKVEVGWLNLCRLNGVEPDSTCGYVFLNQVRKQMGLPI